MKNPKKRILNSHKILLPLLKEEDPFYIAISHADYLKCPDLVKYGLQKNYVEKASFCPKPVRSVSKANVNGKFVRAIPESKITVRKRIDYIRRTDGAHICYDRDFHIYLKELQHKFNIKLSFISKDEQKFVTSPVLTFNDGNKVKNTHVINLFLEIFGDFEVYKTSLEPAIAINKRYNFEILPSGILDDENMNHLIERARRFTKDETQVKAFKERLDHIRGYNPTFVGQGSKGFDGYTVFGFEPYGIAIIESMYSSNATYVFDLTDYESLICQNKMDLIRNKTFKRRIYHYDNWKHSIESLLQPSKAA